MSNTWSVGWIWPVEPCQSAPSAAPGSQQTHMGHGRAHAVQILAWLELAPCEMQSNQGHVVQIQSGHCAIRGAYPRQTVPHGSCSKMCATHSAHTSSSMNEPHIVVALTSLGPALHKSFLKRLLCSKACTVISDQ